MNSKQIMKFDLIVIPVEIYERNPDGTRGPLIKREERPLSGMNDGRIWIRSDKSDEEAASTMLHECLHDTIEPPPGTPPEDRQGAEEVLVRIRQEQWRIDNGLPERYPRIWVGGRQRPDADSIRRKVMGSPVYNPNAGGNIVERGRPNIKGEVPIPKGSFKCGCERSDWTDWLPGWGPELEESGLDDSARMF